jgi:hypothetical protein
MLSIGLWRWYINITITILDNIHCLLFKTQLNSTGLSVPHRKHITSPLLAQQVNAIYRFEVSGFDTQKGGEDSLFPFKATKEDPGPMPFPM